jgi:hypothetical protein
MRALSDLRPVAPKRWHLADAQPAKVTSYRLLWSARLEEVIDSIVAYAF